MGPIILTQIWEEALFSKHLGLKCNPEPDQSKYEKNKIIVNDYFNPLQGKPFC